MTLQITGGGTLYRAFTRLARTFHEYREMFALRAFDAPLRTGACSGLSFRRGEGQALSKVRQRRAETLAAQVCAAKALAA